MMTHHDQANQQLRQNARDLVKSQTATSSRTTRSGSGALAPTVPCDLSVDQLVLAVRGETNITPEMFTISVKGKDRETRKRQHMTPRGQIVAAVRKSLCNIACADYGKILMTDLSKDSFAKSEVILGATRIASFQRFHETMEQKILHSSSTLPAICVHSFSGYLRLD